VNHPLEEEMESTENETATGTVSSQHSCEEQAAQTTESNS